MRSDHSNSFGDVSNVRMWEYLFSLYCASVCGVSMHDPAALNSVIFLFRCVYTTGTQLVAFCSTGINPQAHKTKNKTFD